MLPTAGHGQDFNGSSHGNSDVTGHTRASDQSKGQKMTTSGTSQEALAPHLGTEQLRQDGCRRIHLDKHHHGGRSPFVSNYVSTTKYELWNIVPKNLLEQFQRAANFWFLTVSIFQMLPGEFSPTNQYATILPLCCVLFVTFCKDAWEDYGRRRDDRRVNNQRCKVVDCNSEPTAVRDTRWKDLVVGSYVHLERDAPVPADMILLSSSNEDGVAYVDTAQLDGETSLKPKFALEDTMNLLDLMDIKKLEGFIDTEQPNELVQSFSGTLFLRGYPRGSPIDVKNFLLRGSTLRNTTWIFGIVVFTGVDTKLVQNSKRTPSKRSHVEVLANRLLFIVFGMLVLLSLASSAARAIWLAGGGAGSAQMRWVWPETDPLQDNQYLAFITFMIGYNNLIPISLYVTTDLVRTFQGMMMEWDESMYHPVTDSFCRVRNSGLCENLGQVDFVLSDKTGTLTENKMSFKACCIRGRVYGCWDPDTGPVKHVVALPPRDICVPLDLNMWRLPPSAKSGSEERQADKAIIDHFFLCLATCHTAIVEELPEELRRVLPVLDLEAMSLTAAPNGNSGRRNSGSRRTSRKTSPSDNEMHSPRLASDDVPRPSADLLREAQSVTFRSSSPDEEALVAAARDHGYFFRKRVASRVMVNVRGKDQCYTVLACNEFSSERKRMSVLISKTTSLEATPSTLSASSSATLYVKGADNVMFERLKGGEGGQKVASQLKHQLNKFASCGLRTLVLAKREVSAAQADIFVQKMLDAKGSLLYREMALEEVADEMERQLEFLGITAIEDKIQQGVPETINMLLRAGIKVWMLTGDNMETAINIGVACSLITQSSMKQYMLDIPSNKQEASAAEVLRKLEGFYNDITHKLRVERRPGAFQYCVVVHGSVLYTIMDEYHVRLRQLFLAIAGSSCSVIACRLAPAQKAALVKLVRNEVVGSPLTLSIGDGGNDVSMIQEAHVGVGILGVEGRQAANASDFVISQFRFLRTLLLVHGRWNLRRIGIVIGYSFYKNFTLVLPMVYYAFYTGFSGTTLYDSYLLTCYNLFFTSLPIMITGVFDFDVNRNMALLVPSLYQLGIKRKYFNSWMLIGWIARGALHSLLIFIGMRFLFEGSMADGEGNVPDYLVMGSWGYWACVVVVNVTLLLHTKAWMDWLVFVVLGSALIFLPMLMLYSQEDNAEMLNANMVGVGSCLFGRLGSWLCMLLVASTCVLSDLAVVFARKVSQPDVGDILQEVQLGHLNGTDRYSKCRPEPLPVPTDEADRVVDQVAEHDDTDGLDENSEQDSDDSPDMHANRAERYLQRLPAPPPRMHQVKPVNGVGLEPLQSRHNRHSKSRSKARVAAAVSKKRFGGVNGLSAVVPTASPRDTASTSTMPSSLDRSSLDRSMSWDPSRAAFTARDSGCLNRLWRATLNLIDQLYRQQWCEMTVGELLGGFSYNKMMVSKHFKSAIRQYGTGAPSRGDDHKHREQVSNHGSDGFSPCGSQPVSSVDSETSIGIGCADSKNSTKEATSLFRMATDQVHDTTEVVKDLIYSIVTLRFFSETQESEFRKYFSKQAVLIIQNSLLALSVALIMYNLYEVIAYDSARTIMRAMVIVGIVPATIIVVICLRQGHVARHAEWYIAAFIMVIIAVKHGYDILADSIGILANSYMPVFIMAGARIRITFICLVLLFHILGLVVRYWLLSEYLVVETSRFSFMGEDDKIEAEYFVLMIGITVLSLYYAYLIEKLMRQDFIVLFSLVGSKHQAMEILRDMFPDEVINHVITQIRNEQAKGRKSSTDLVPVKPIREDCGVVTVLFCDIYDFESLVEKLQPTELVQLLDLVWMMFDRICSQHQMSKIETVGKTYMAAALPQDGKDLAVGVTNALSTAVAMLELMEKRVLGVGKIPNVSVKIGIHTGQAMCGVVGSRKPQFALFGDTVNTAARMQSTGQKNHVHVSSATYEYVIADHRFKWMPQNTFVKGKGYMPTYLLRGHTMPSRRMSGGTGGSPPVTIAPVDRPSPTPVPPAYPRRPDPPRPPETAPPLELVNGNTYGAASSIPSDTTSTVSPDPGYQDGSHKSLPSLAEDTGIAVADPSISVARRKSGETTVNCESGMPTSRDTDSVQAPSTINDGRLSQSLNDGRMSQNTEDFAKVYSRESHHTDASGIVRVRESLLGISINELSGMAAMWTGRLSTTNHSRDFWKSRSNLMWAFVCCSRCRRARDGAVHEVLENSGQDIKAIWVSLQAFWACYAAESLFLLLGRQGRTAKQPLILLVARMGYLGMALIVSLMLHRLGKRCRWDLGLKSSLGSSVFSDVVSLLVFAGFVCSTVTNLHCLPDGSEFWNVFEAFFFVMVLMHLCRLNLQGVVPVCLCGVTILIMAITTAAQADTVLLLECLVYSLLIFGAQLFAMLRDPRRSRKEHEAICEEHDRVNQLLDSMMPREVLHEMKAGNLSLAYDYENMTFLFADIVGFTSYCASHTPEDCVNLVTELFAKFDETTVSLGIYKVCTIGDAYVVVNEPRTQVQDKFADCERVFTLALKMLQIIEVTRVKVNFEELNMRIGLHFGRFVGGVIGTKRVRFDIWGEDVIIGNSIESEGIKGRICVSEQAKKVLEVDACGVGNLRFSFNRDIELKNKRIIKSYEVCSEYSEPPEELE